MSRDYRTGPSMQRRVETTPRWVRAVVDDVAVGDSKRAILHVAFGPPLVPGTHVPLLPGYFFPAADVRTDVLVESGEDADRRWWDVLLGDRRIDRAAWTYTSRDETSMDLTDHVTFRWEAVDGWFEEDEQVFHHARDPRKRIDVRASTRAVEVRHHGQLLASSRRPRLLFETDLPTRYYFAPADVHMEHLVPSDHRSGCAYKGTATYFSHEAAGREGRGIAWTYPEPFDGCEAVRGLISFFNERVDIVVDGVQEERPVTPWS